MDCGFCGGGMRSDARRGVEIDACGGCGGVFFDPGELEGFAGLPRLEERLRREAAGRPLTGRRCPACGGATHAGPAGEGLMDLCDACGGLALDRAALALAAGMALAGGAAVSHASSAPILSDATLDAADVALDVGVEVAGLAMDLHDGHRHDVIGEALASSGEALQAAGDLGDVIYDALSDGDAAEAVAGGAGEAAGAILEGAEGAGEIAVEVAGGLLENAGDVLVGAGELAGALAENAGDLLEGAFSLLGAVLGAIGEIFS
jgi:Zn-finger nucleic acid-binding protein